MPTSRRQFALVLVTAALAACGGSEESATTDLPTIEGDSRIACALAGARDLVSTCAFEREWVDNRLQLVVRHPDGGFRRFNVVSDGRGVEAADGSESAFVHPLEGAIEVIVGADRYRFPATIEPPGNPDDDGS